MVKSKVGIQIRFCLSLVQNKQQLKNATYIVTKINQLNNYFSSMNKTILLPGGIGYIGSHVVVDLLLKTTYNLTIVDNYLNSTENCLKRIYATVESQLNFPSDINSYKSRVKFFQGNILNYPFLQSVFKTQKQSDRNITTIIHFAAKKSAPQSMYQPLDYFQNNLVGSMNLLKLMQKYTTCKEFIFSSSAAVYGEQDNCTEEFQCLPVSPYGQSKLCVDMLLKSMAKCHKDWKVVSLRYFNPAGNHHSGLIGDNPIGNIPGNLFAVIQECIIGKRQKITVFGSDYNTPDGSGVRDFIHVVDLSSGHLCALNYLQKMGPENNYEVFNLGSGNGFSVLEVLTTFQNLLKHPLVYQIGPRRPGDLERLVTASKKAQLILGWSPKKTLSQMCESCIAFTIQLVRKPQNQ